MTRAERKWHRRDVLEGAARELASHESNGSGWLWAENNDGSDRPTEEALDYRLAVLRGLVKRVEREARRDTRGAK